MTCIFDLKTHVIDFSNDFSQTEQKGPPVYMEFRTGVGMNSYEVVILKKLLYGQTEVPRIWFEKLKAGLEDQNFEPIDSDPCRFISDKFICLVYFGNFSFFAKYGKDIDEVIKSFQN